MRIHISFVRPFISALAFTAALATACADRVEGCGYTASCSPDSGGQAGAGGSERDGGASGRGGEPDGGDGGDTCDTTRSPSDEPCLVHDDHSIFVAPSGRDEAAGTMDAPVRSIAHAIQLAAATQRRVILCDATYAEAVTLTASAQLHGGFACPGTDEAAAWSRTEGHARVAPDTPGYALEIRGVTAPLTIEDVEFEALDAAESGGSSIAAFVVSSPSVTLRRVTLRAGVGRDGVEGANSGYTFPTEADLQGNDGTATVGGAPKQCVCPGADAPSTSGGGGGAIPDGGGGSGAPRHGETGGRGGRNGAACEAGGWGTSGAAGPSAPHAARISSVGQLTEDGWQPASGSPAPDGSPGQGGGGGAGRPGGGGGSGGCGGCGGRGGEGGQAGGSSIALLALNSPVQLLQSSLQVANAGHGGDGAAGQRGQQAFGGRGRGFGLGDGGCNGGNGGIGGDGGSGAGAAGGLSVGVLFRGAAPTRRETTVTLGTPGIGGVGGTPQVNDGLDGVAREELQL